MTAYNTMQPQPADGPQVKENTQALLVTERDSMSNAADECFYCSSQEESCSYNTLQDSCSHQIVVNSPMEQDSLQYSELVVTNSLISSSHYLARLCVK